jgi:hypothetical protein
MQAALSNSEQASPIQQAPVKQVLIPHSVFGPAK